MTELPIEEVLPGVREALQVRGCAVVQAPPGAGKTTRVPLALLNEPWLEGRSIILLEPRRLAARAAAHRMAYLLSERVGRTVGYRVRMDTQVSRTTRIEVVTEGVLTRMLQDDPALERAGLVIFDEFHERSLHADLGLALCLQTRAYLREDLRLLVMSATLDGDVVAELLGDAPVITSEGRSFPVQTRYLKHRPSGRLEATVASAVRKALHQEEGDILVFLPGAGEIRRVEARLKESGEREDVRILPLYGNLPPSDQDAAIAPSPPGKRKVVLATSIAETSLTIEGVHVVVDSGLRRMPRFDPRSGMTRLVTTRVSRAAADQRRGRAGRLGPGVCYRLWTRHEQQHLRSHELPEILEADLAPLALELAQWGVTDPAELTWLDPPPEAAYAQASDLLVQLGALHEEGGVTEHGRRMADLGLHPRLGHMVLRAQSLGLAAVACDLAALLSERDIFRCRDGLPEADLRLRLEVLQKMRRGERVHVPYGQGCQVDRSACRRILRLAQYWRRRLRVSGGEGDLEACGLLLAFAYPDRIAQQRPGRPGRYRLRNGRAAALAEPQLLTETPFLVAAHLDGRRPESRVFLAAPVDREDLEAYFGDQICEESVIAWDEDGQRVRARRRRTLGALVLAEAPLADPPPQRVAETLVAGVAREGLQVLPWTKTARRIQQRVVFLHRLDPDWPDLSDETLLKTLHEWLTPHVYGMTRAADLQQLNLTEILLGLLAWEQRARLDELAPTHITVPSGSRIPIDYSNPDAPVLAVRLQELFGLTETPRIARGQVPLTLHLLSPAHRPVQVTQDLSSFWRETYFEVRKDLRGRYPKHYWPEDPMKAEPTNRTRPR